MPPDSLSEKKPYGVSERVGPLNFTNIIKINSKKSKMNDSNTVDV